MAAELFPFYLSVQGAAHERREKDAENAAAGRKFPCQDRSFAEKCELAGKRGGSCYVSCVCDGHGGAAYFRSGTGAALAVESIRTCVAASAAPLLRLIASSPSQAKAALQDLTRAILQDWCRRVDADLEICPITEKEWAFLDQDDPAAADRYRKGEDLRSIYGTTALACACGGGAWFALQIGDGDIVLHTEKKGFCKPVPEDERLFLNQTTSLCDTDAENEFRTACGREEPDAILCSSDGIANSFAGDKGLFEFYGKLLWLFRDWDGADEEEDGGTSPAKAETTDGTAAAGGKAAAGKAAPDTAADSATGIAAIVGRLGRSLSRSASLPDVQARFDAALEELKASLPDIGRRGSGDDLSLAGYIGIDPVKVREHIKCRELIPQGKAAYEAGRTEKAEDCFRKAAENGYPKGWYLLGCLYRDEGLRDDALDALEKAVSQGVQEAAEPLALLLYDAAHARQELGDHQAAFASFTRSAELGNRESQYALGMYYGSPQSYPGCNVRQNFARAVEWTLSAARQGHPDAECKMGKCYRDGRGVQKDEQQAREWYEKAAAHGSKEAKEYLEQTHAAAPHPAGK